MSEFTVVSFHAHPDDEVLFTGGYLAMLAQAGHRVVLVFATAGELGAVSPSLVGQRSVADVRTAEARRSAAILGCSRVEFLGFGDSGSTATTPSPNPSEHAPFALADPEEAATRLAHILKTERAQILTTYDAQGGYGHPDHLQVHRVGARAAELAGTPLVLEATVDRTVLCRAVRTIRRIRWLLPGLDLPDFSGRFSPPSEITYRVDVRAQAATKRTAMTAHLSQTVSDSGLRTLRFFLLLPRPLFRKVLGHEWYVARPITAPHRETTAVPPAQDRNDNPIEGQPGQAADHLSNER